MRSRAFAVALAVAVLPIAPANSEDLLSTLRIDATPPAVSIEVRVNGTEGRIELPTALAVQQLPQTMDADGITAFRRPDGRLVYHVGNISAQLAGASNSDIDIDALARGRTELTAEQRAALRWIERNASPIDAGALVWRYEFEHVFNNILIRTPWPSSFAQADVIKALLVAHRITKEQRLLELALQAARAFDVPCERGGLRCVIGGVAWYAELPLPYGFSPLILNGHLYSTAMLGRLYALTRDPVVARLFRDGARSAKSEAHHYDTGYWTVYQRRPRMNNGLFLLRSEQGGPVLVHEISLRSPWSLPVTHRFGATTEISRPDPPTAVWGDGWQAPTDRGRVLKGHGFVQLRPNRLAIENDPVSFPGFELVVRYSAAGCRGPQIASFDYRAEIKGYMSLSPPRIRREGDSCVASYPLRNAVFQWTQLNRFYHDWHTRLMEELADATNDETLLRTARRWRGYLKEFDRIRAETDGLVIRQPTYRIEPDGQAKPVGSKG